MRWTWIIPRLILVALIWSAFAFGLDPWLRHMAIMTAQSVTGAQADIATINTGLFPPVMTVSDVAFASAKSPGTNLIEFDKLECQLSGHALLRRSLVIEQAQLTGVRFETVRNDDGQLEEVSDPESQEPSWLTEKLQDAGSQWLDDLVADTREQLDPNTLETWRTGQMLTVKWEERMRSLQDELNSFKPRADQLQQEMDRARELPSVERVQQYLKLAGDGERLVREAGQIQQKIKDVVPEATADLRTLDQARRNDQQMVVQKVRQLKPSPQRIAESLLGPDMYRQIHQAVSWLKAGASYHQQIRQQTKVVRHRGQAVEFPILNPVPGFLCRRMEISGELLLGQDLLPFHAILSDVTSDPVLLGQPTVFRLKTAGEEPLQVALRYDATSGSPTTDMVVDLHEIDPRLLTVGHEESAVLTAALSNLHWTAQLQVQGESLDGTIRVESRLTQANLASEQLSPLLQTAVTDVLSNLETVDGTVHVTGLLDNPDVQIHSRFSEQIADGLQLAYRKHADQIKAALASRVDQLANEQKQKLTRKLNDRYQSLVADHKATISKIQGTQRLLASVRSGQANPQELFRQVSGSGILSEKQEERVGKQLQQSNRLLRGLGNGLLR